jgi:hypothetical protein
VILGAALLAPEQGKPFLLLFPLLFQKATGDNLGHNSAGLPVPALIYSQGTGLLLAGSLFYFREFDSSVDFSNLVAAVLRSWQNRT